MRKTGQVYLKVRDITDYSIIDWEYLTTRYYQRKFDKETFLLKQPRFTRNNIGQCIKEIFDDNMPTLSGWGVYDIVFTHTILKNGIHKLNYTIDFEGSPDSFENPFHILGIDGESRCNWL